MILPEDFIRETRLVMGEERYNRFMGAFNEEAPTSIRINPKFLRKEERGKWKAFHQFNMWHTNIEAASWT